MRTVTSIVLGSAFALNAIAQEPRVPRVEVDPNTKIEGGADLRGSGADAGATTQPDHERDKSVARPEKREPEKDNPTTERKPEERAPEEPTLFRGPRK